MAQGFEFELDAAPTIERVGELVRSAARRGDQTPWAASLGVPGATVRPALQRD